MDLRWLIPLVIGFAFNLASAFTGLYSRWWGPRTGQLATVLLRNVLGIPVWVLGLIAATRTPSAALFHPATLLRVVAWLLMAFASLLQLWALAALRQRAAAPALGDTLVEQGPYRHVRHPIYVGLILDFVAVVILQARVAVLGACALGLVWTILQARAEEIDLLRRVPGYREYMMRVSAFWPRASARGAA